MKRNAKAHTEVVILFNFSFIVPYENISLYFFHKPRILPEIINSYWFSNFLVLLGYESISISDLNVTLYVSMLQVLYCYSCCNVMERLLNLK